MSSFENPHKRKFEMTLDEASGNQGNSKSSVDENTHDGNNDNGHNENGNSNGDDNDHAMIDSEIIQQQEEQAKAEEAARHEEARHKEYLEGEVSDSLLAATASAALARSAEGNNGGNGNVNNINPNNSVVDDENDNNSNNNNNNPGSNNPNNNPNNTHDLNTHHYQPHFQPHFQTHAPKPATGTDEWHRMRRDSHKEVERRRRETINDGIRELAELVPNCDKNKGQILRRAAEYIRELKQNDAGRVEKWTLDKILSEQAISEVSASNEKLKQELRRAWREVAVWKKACVDNGVKVDEEE